MARPINQATPHQTALLRPAAGSAASPNRSRQGGVVSNQSVLGRIAKFFGFSKPTPTRYHTNIRDNYQRTAGREVVTPIQLNRLAVSGTTGIASTRPNDAQLTSFLADVLRPQ